jgi:hypothetical protein
MEELTVSASSCPLLELSYLFSVLSANFYIYLKILLAAYMSSPCHIELTLSEKEEPVKKEVI